MSVVWGLTGAALTVAFVALVVVILVRVFRGR